MKRSIALDCIRGVAVLLVLFFHYLPGNSGSAIIRHIQMGGWVGVDMFFPLSGFLVAGLLFREYSKTCRVNILRFLARRGFKIYPPYYFMLALNVWWFAIPPTAYLPEFLFVQNYSIGFLPHTWSLAVEEHFYLLLALLILALARSREPDPFRSVPWIAAALACAAFAFRLSISAVPFAYLVHYLPTHLRIDELMLGAALAYVYHYHRPGFEALARRRRWCLILTGCGGLLPPFVWSLSTPFIHTAGYTLAALGTAALITALALTPLPDWLPVRALAFIGKHSYSIYLWHMAPVVSNLLQQIHPALAILAAILIGVALSFGVEGSALGIRNILVPPASHVTVHE